MHGYDVIDHSRVDPARGGPEALAEFCDAAHARGLKVLVDIVPNHVGVATPRLNPWWWDVLAAGRASRFADHFDIDWDAGGGRLRLPILGDGPDELDALTVEDGELRYYDHRLPIAAGTGEGSPREVHDRQHYELVSWRRADSELNYRRFFAVNTLAAIRVEDQRVFDESHAEIGRWLREGLVDGLRVDHPDGLRDPGEYLRRLVPARGGPPDLGGEDPRGSRADARLAGLRHHRLRRPGPRRPGVRRPGGRGSADRVRHRDRRPRRVRRLARPGAGAQALGRRRHPELGDQAARADARRRRSGRPGPGRGRGRRARGLLPRLPQLPPVRRRVPGRGAGCGTRRPTRPRRRDRDGDAAARRPGGRGRASAFSRRPGW